MPPTKENFRYYTEEAIQNAVNDVLLHKTPIREAARKFGVPRTTLKYKVEGKLPMERTMGPPSILNKAEEEEICKWIMKMAAAGFPVTVGQLTTSVRKYITELKRPNPFKDDTPGKTWVKSFLKRNQSISTRVSQNLTSSRAGVTTSDLQNWFSEVLQYLKQNNLNMILNDPARLFNSDESAFFLNPKGTKVLAKKGEKNVYQQVNADEKECVTVLITASASGLVAPPTVLFKYKRIPQDIVDNFPGAWGFGKTDSGWMTCEAFYEFIANIFYPWLVEKHIVLPVILFIDGHVSHLSFQTSQFCDSHGIILVALYSNATHLLQPLDVAVFKTLKEGWRKKVQEWRRKNLDAPKLKKRHFPKLLKEVIDERVTEGILSNGFRKCGLHPWNPSAVQVPGEDNNNNSTALKTDLIRMKTLQQGFSFLNANIERDKIDSFRCSDVWEGAIEDTSLFLLWKKTQTELESYGIHADENNAPDVAELTEDNSFPLDSSYINYSNLKPDELIHEAEQLLSDIASLDEQPLTSGNSATSPTGLLDQASAAVDVPTLDEQPSTSGNSATSPTGLLDQAAAPTAILPQDRAGASCDFMADPSPKVPSPFKRHFFYRSERETKKRRTSREKIPTIVSGKLCQEYFLKKLKKKEDMERLKKERAAERQRKREERDKVKQDKSQKLKLKRAKTVLRCSSESSNSSFKGDSSESDGDSSDHGSDHFRANWIPVKKTIGEFVVFLYEGEYFPGKITRVTKKEATISAMIRSGRLWKWPERPDTLNYNWKDVVSHISEPLKTRKTRDVYSIPELDFIWN